MKLARHSFVFFIRHIWIALGLFYLIVAVYPASRWYDVGTLEIPVSREGEPVLMLYTGGPLKPFVGSYAVTVRHLDNGMIACEASGGPFPYKPGTTRPDPLTMDWWAPSDPRCSQLRSGTYVIVNCWEIEGLAWGLIPNKRLCSSPKAFNIAPARKD